MTEADPFVADDDVPVETVGADETAAAGSDAAAADSPLSRLRRAFVARRREAELLLPIPGWGDALIARVTVPDHDFARKLTGTPGTIDWMGDFVAETVAGLYERESVDEDGEPQLTPLEGPHGPLRFDHHFSELAGLGSLPPRGAVHAVFTSGGEGSIPVVNAVALADFANTIEIWLSDTSREIAEAIVPGR